MQPPSLYQAHVALEAIFVLTEGVWEIAGLQANLTLSVCTDQATAGPGTRDVTFRADSGAAVTSMGLPRANRLGIPVPPEAIERHILTAAGPVTRMVREGRIRAFLPGWPRAEAYEWPCIFVEGQSDEVPPLLGLLGVIEDIRLTFDGTPTPGVAFGNLIVEVLR